MRLIPCSPGVIRQIACPDATESVPSWDRAVGVRLGSHGGPFSAAINVLIARPAAASRVRSTASEQEYAHWSRRVAVPVGLRDHRAWRRRGPPARTLVIGTDARCRHERALYPPHGVDNPLTMSTTRVRARVRGAPQATPWGTHTRTLIYVTPAAHNGLIPPLCAAPCFLIPALVCDTKKERGPDPRRMWRTRGECGGPAGNAADPVACAARPRSRPRRRCGGIRKGGWRRP